MNALQTLPNNTSGSRFFLSHEVTIPVCCPVSRNPRPGSTLTVIYRAKEQVLEVASLYAYLHQFVGGLRDRDGELEVRDMEGMLQCVAHDCAQVLHVPVRLHAQLQIVPRQQVLAIFRGYPKLEEERIHQL